MAEAIIAVVNASPAELQLEVRSMADPIATLTAARANVAELQRRLEESGTRSAGTRSAVVVRPSARDERLARILRLV